MCLFTKSHINSSSRWWGGCLNFKLKKLKGKEMFLKGFNQPFQIETETDRQTGRQANDYPKCTMKASYRNERISKWRNEWQNKCLRLDFVLQQNTTNRFKHMLISRDIFICITMICTCVYVNVHFTVINVIVNVSLRVSLKAL